MDIQNELREAWNALQILRGERVKLRELFIAFQFRFEKLKEKLKQMTAAIAE